MCDHEWKTIKREDAPNIDFHKEDDGSDSKRWETLQCIKCGEINTKPIV